MTTCPNSPRSFSNAGNGTFRFGYASKGGVTNPTTSWCKVDTSGSGECDIQMGGIDSCASGEAWMQFPNAQTAKGRSSSYNNKGRAAAMKTDPGKVVMDMGWVATTFAPVDYNRDSQDGLIPAQAW